MYKTLKAHYSWSGNAITLRTERGIELTKNFVYLRSSCRVVSSFHAAKKSVPALRRVCQLKMHEVYKSLGNFSFYATFYLHKNFPSMEADGRVGFFSFRYLMAGKTDQRRNWSDLRQGVSRGGLSRLLAKKHSADFAYQNWAVWAFKSFEELLVASSSFVAGSF